MSLESSEKRVWPNEKECEALLKKYTLPIDDNNYFNNMYPDVFKLPKKEFEDFEYAYNERVKNQTQMVNELVQYVDDDRKLRYNFALEIPVLKTLKKTIIKKNKNAIYIPNFKEDVALKKIGGGLGSAFAMKTPLRVVMHSDFIDTLTPIGMLFIIMHEVQHIVRNHTDRMLGRDPLDWNLATDLIINSSILRSKLPKLYEKHINELNKTHLFKKDFLYSVVTSYIGSEFDENNPEIKKRMSSLTEDEREYYLEKNKILSFKTIDKDYKIEEGVYQLLEKLKKPSGNNNSFESNEDHMPDELEMGKKLNEFAKNLSPEFGEYQEEMMKEIQDLINELGVPTSEQEKNKMGSDVQKKLDDALKESEQLEQEGKKIGINASDVSDLIKRNKEVKRKLNFKNFIKTFAREFSESGRVVKSNELTTLSRLTKLPVVNQDLLGIGAPVKMYKTKREQDVLKAIAIIDTSGSVDRQYDIANQMLPEINDVVMSGKMEVIAISADTESKSNSILINKKNIKKIEKEGLNIIGGGGTDMLEPLVHEYIYNPVQADIMLIFSDGYYNMFNKKELMDATKIKHQQLINDNTLDPKLKSELLKRVKLNFNSSKNEYNYQSIILLNTQEKTFENEKIKTFAKGQVQEFVLSKIKEEQVVNIQHQSNKKFIR